MTTNLPHFPVLQIAIQSSLNYLLNNLSYHTWICYLCNKVNPVFLNVFLFFTPCHWSISLFLSVFHCCKFHCFITHRNIQWSKSFLIILILNNDPCNFYKFQEKILLKFDWNSVEFIDLFSENRHLYNCESSYPSAKFDTSLIQIFFYGLQ